MKNNKSNKKQNKTKHNKKTKNKKKKKKKTQNKTMHHWRRVKEARGAEPSHLSNFDLGALKRLRSRYGRCGSIESYWMRVQICSRFNLGSCLQFPEEFHNVKLQSRAFWPCS